MGKRQPYTRRIKRPVTLRLEQSAIAYFRRLARQLGLPYQTLINLYLRDCASKRMRPRSDWRREL
jgi:predicted DNA binding CopG/RHH family protein